MSPLTPILTLSLQEPLHIVVFGITDYRHSYPGHSIRRIVLLFDGQEPETSQLNVGITIDTG